MPRAERVGVAAGRRLQRALEVVDDRQQLEQHVGGGVLRQLAALALDPLAVVVEVRGRAEELLLQRVAFASAAQPGPRRRLPRVAAPAASDCSAVVSSSAAVASM